MVIKAKVRVKCGIGKEGSEGQGGGACKVRLGGGQQDRSRRKRRTCGPADEGHPRGPDNWVAQGNAAAASDAAIPRGAFGCIIG